MFLLLMNSDFFTINSITAFGGEAYSIKCAGSHK